MNEHRRPRRQGACVDIWREFFTVAHFRSTPKTIAKPSEGRKVGLTRNATRKPSSKKRRKWTFLSWLSPTTMMPAVFLCFEMPP